MSSLRKHSSKKYVPKPSSFLKKQFDGIKISQIGPILDIPSGSGRNAMFFHTLGCNVVCVDNDWTALRSSLESSRKKAGPADGQDTRIRPQGRLLPLWTDLSKNQWPFRKNCFAAIINIHFVMPELFKYFQYSLMPGGYLLCETYGGQGENYLQLPRPGEWKARLESWLDIETYEEKPAGPISNRSVIVKLLGRKS